MTTTTFSMEERRVTFYSEELGIKLHRGTDGLVRVIHDTANGPPGHAPYVIPGRQGTLQVGDVLLQVNENIDLRGRPMTNRQWIELATHIKVLPRPVVLVFAAEHENKPMSSTEKKVANKVDSLVAVDEAFDPFGLQDEKPKVGEDSIQSNDAINEAVEVPLAVSKVVEERDSSANGNQKQKYSRSRSMTPPRSFLGLIKRKGSHIRTGSSKSGATSPTVAATNVTSSKVSQLMQKSTACLVPTELKEILNPSESKQHRMIQQTQSCDNSLLDDNVAWETQIECNDMYEMLRVSNISLDDALLPQIQDLDDSLEELDLSDDSFAPEQHHNSRAQSRVQTRRISF